MGRIVSLLNSSLLNNVLAFCLNMVFNTCMSEATKDRELIERLGGPTRVAELLGWPKYGGAQRVQNWLSRGIPPAVKVKWPDLFMSEQHHSQDKAD